MKITYGNVQPNSKESKIWLDDKGLLRTYNSKQLKWNTDATSSDTNTPEVDDKPEDTPKTITFFVYDDMTLDTLEYKAEEGMTWGLFIETENNTWPFNTLEYNNKHLIVVSQIWGGLYRVISNDQLAVTSTLEIVPGYTYITTDFMI